MSNYLIYDCEIIKCIPTKGHRIETLEYCDGWTDHANMGISVIGYYLSNDLHPYTEGFHVVENSESKIPYDFATFPYFGDLLTLIQQSDFKLIGFNSRNFDDRLLAANGLEAKTDYDLLEEVRIAAGWSASYTSVPKGYSYSLDAIARANGMAKTGSGALAPQLWQEGKYAEVVAYCAHDVEITHSLLQLGLEGKLKDPNTGELLTLRALE